MACPSPHQGLRPVGNAQPRRGQHGKIVRAVADGDHLLKGQPFLRRQGPKELRLPRSVYDGARHRARHHAIVHGQLIGKNVVDTQPGLQLFPKKLETAADDGGFVAQTMKRVHQALGALRQGQGLERSHPAQLPEGP